MYNLKQIDFIVGKVGLNDSETNVATPFYATKRLDNGKHLGVVAKNYPIFQPSEMLEVVNRLCSEMDYEIFADYSINDGKQVMLSVKTGNIKIGDDNIVKQINIANSFNRSTGVNFNFGNLTVRCANQFSKIVKGSQFSFDHSSRMFENIEEMIKSIKKLNELEIEHYDCLSKFVSTPLSKDLAMKLAGEILDVKFDYTNDVILFDEDLSTRKKNIFARFENSYEEEVADLGNTVYGFMNAGTNYVTHVLKQPHSGNGLRISNLIYDKGLKLI